MTSSHSPLLGSERKPLPGAVATSRTNPNATIEVTLKLRRKNLLPPLTKRPDKILTRDQLRDTYGATQADVDHVVKTLGTFGLALVNSSLTTRSVRMRGTVSSMEAAFQVHLFNYTHPNGNYRGRVGVVHIPSDLAGIVQAVFGLDNRRIARRRRQPIRDDPQASSGSASSSWYISSQLATHYNFPAGDGTGQAVGLLEFGGGYFPADLQQFCTMANIPTLPTVTPISTDGTPTNAKDGAEGEVMLDIEVVAGVCPKANIVVYFANWSEQGWITNLDAAMNDSTNNPGVLSVSWGQAEDTDIWTTQAIDQLNETFQDLANVGITICVAAGDDGSSDAVTDGLAHVDFPGSSPYALCVGGTTIPSRTTQQPDIVWFEGDGLRADNGGSTGGGVSTVFPLPAWQSGINIPSVNAGAIAGRCIPDLAANADWNASPYLLVVDGQAQPNGGTSAASPLIASLLTLINQARAAASKTRVGYITAELYQSSTGGNPAGSSGCTDVTSGNNDTAADGGYSAGQGYDAASGWGTPNGQNLAAALP
ncbi:MAG TPA: S53 family peptidase [Candidatus Sulfotelmatobacter sp.]|nr:S53 family peptidase [Candidatus Sulfotelmatobacter sp.]